MHVKTCSGTSYGENLPDHAHHHTASKMECFLVTLALRIREDFWLFLIFPAIAIFSPHLLEGI